MEVFFKKNIYQSTTIAKRQKRYNSVYATINSAIKKAHVSKEEIDYVMMIGGSSKNPFVQRSIREYFGEETTMLLPPDMQNLVSQGAAIHSLMVNAFDIVQIPHKGHPVLCRSNYGSPPAIADRHRHGYIFHHSPCSFLLPGTRHPFPANRGKAGIVIIPDVLMVPVLINYGLILLERHF
jgi:hypothetical protein